MSRMLIGASVPDLLALFTELVPRGANHRVTMDEPIMTDANGDMKAHVITDKYSEEHVERVVPGVSLTVQVDYRDDESSPYFNIVTKPVVPLCDPFFLKNYVVPHCANLINHVIDNRKKEQ
jgi:hypothetical protein